ncbi:MAG: DUF2190 family protein [Roseibium sp.]|nr:DUF2190 family protein [Roseibium sp.]
MKNYIKPGNVLTMIAPTGGVVSGSLYEHGTIVGVATGPAAEGEEYELSVNGVFELAKTAAQAWAVGDAIYRDSATGLATSVATANTKCGVAVAAAANPSGTGLVRLNGSF